MMGKFDGWKMEDEVILVDRLSVPVLEGYKTPPNSRVENCLLKGISGVPIPPELDSMKTQDRPSA